MKKQAIISCCVYLATACSTNPYSNNETLADMFIWGAPKQEMPKVKKQKVAVEKVKEVKTVEIPVEDIDAAVNVETFSVAKRGERYEQASYNITPQIYGIVAGRAVNKMLAEVPALLAEDKYSPLFVAPTVKIDRYLPAEPDVTAKTAKEIIYGAKMFALVDSKDEATYVLEGSLNNINTPEIPVIVYEIKLVDSKGNQVGKWSDSIRQVQNDDGSWW